jgi:hypothetical protein
MPMQRTQAGLLAKYGKMLIEAHEAHKADRTVKGDLELPPGIENGVARLDKCGFGVYKTGEYESMYFFSASASVVEPVEFKGVPIFGRHTRIGPEPLCNTPNRTRKTFKQHLAWVYNIMRLLGARTDKMSPKDIEATCAALVKAGPYILFRTWKGQPQTSGPYAGAEPRVNHVWLDILPDYVPDTSEVGPGAGATDDSPLIDSETGEVIEVGGANGEAESEDTATEQTVEDAQEEVASEDIMRDDGEGAEDSEVEEEVAQVQANPPPVPQTRAAPRPTPTAPVQAKNGPSKAPAPTPATAKTPTQAPLRAQGSTRGSPVQGKQGERPAAPTTATQTAKPKSRPAPQMPSQPAPVPQPAQAQAQTQAQIVEEGEGAEQEFTEFADIDSLATRAESGDEEAQKELTTLAIEAGITEESINGAKSWADVARMISGGGMEAVSWSDVAKVLSGEGAEAPVDQATEGTTEAPEAEEPEKEQPYIDDVFMYSPPSKGGRPSMPVKVVVTAVDGGKVTVDLRMMGNPKVTWRDVPWAKLMPVNE